MTNDDDFHYTTVTVPAAAFEDDNTLLPLIAALGVSPMADEMMRARDSAKKAPQSLVVFDTETSGLSANWDQILQFAAVSANRNFEIENPDTNTINARCRIRPDVIPSPQALITTRVWPEMLDTAPLSHSELMAQVETFLHESAPAVFAGHNILRFDSPHLRHNLFSALLPPYPLQAPGCRMLDTLRLAHLIFALAPEAMIFPRGANGKVSFKLGDLCRANGIILSDDEAHDALGDVRATLALLKTMREASPTIFAYALALADKRFVVELIEEHTVLGEIGVHGGVASVAPLAVLTDSPCNPNASVAVDLRTDPAEFLSLSDDALDRLIVSRASPFKTIRRNASPLLIPLRLTDTMAPVAAQALRALNDDNDPVAADLELQRRAVLVGINLPFQRRLLNALARREAAREASPHVEEQLYSHGFVGNADFAITRKFLALSPTECASLIPSISDERLKTHAARIVLSEAPESLDSDTREHLDCWLREKLTATGDVPWLTIPQALEETETLRRDMTDEADRLACDLFPDPHPTEQCPDTGAWIEDPDALEDIERSRAAFVEARAGQDLVLLDDFEAWLLAKRAALEKP